MIFKCYINFNTFFRITYSSYRSYIFEMRLPVLTVEVKNDHRSKFSNLSSWKEEAWKNQGFNRIRTCHLCDTGANLCVKIFNGIGANVSISDIDIAHRVQPRNSNRGQRQQPIICKFVRRMAREQVMAARNNANQLTADDLGLSSSTEIGRVAIFCHLPPRLQVGRIISKVNSNVSSSQKKIFN